MRIKISKIKIKFLYMFQRDSEDGANSTIFIISLIVCISCPYLYFMFMIV